MHNLQRFAAAQTLTHRHTGRLLKVIISFLMVIVTVALGWLGFHLFLAAVV